MNRVILEVESGYVSYGVINILKVEYLRLRQGEIMIVRGANGTGKTSLLRVIVGGGPTYSGHIVYMNQKINQSPIWRRVHKGMRLLPQGKSVFGRLSPSQHMSIARYFLPTNDEQSADAIISTSAPRSRELPASALSGGESKIMLLNCLVIGNPQLLLLDEPFAGLESSGAERAVAQITLCIEHGASCLIVDHTGLAESRFPDAFARSAVPSKTTDVLFELQEDTKS